MFHLVRWRYSLHGGSRYLTSLANFTPNKISRQSAPVQDPTSEVMWIAQLVEPLRRLFWRVPNQEIAIAVQRSLFVLIASITGNAPYSIFEYTGRVVVCKLLHEAATAREDSAYAVDWIADATARFSKVLVEAELLSAVSATVLLESARQMVEDIRGREGGDTLTVEDLGIFARPKHCVQLLTVHKAKGREFEAVAVIEAHDGRFPHFSTYKLTDEAERDAQYDESRRVVYDATTRAKRLLMFFSDKSDHRNTPMPFLAEMGL